MSELKKITLDGVEYDLPSGGSGNANIWVGTQEEWDALDKSTIEDGTEVHIVDDAGDVTYRLIKTYDDLMDNTDDNKLVDALVVKEIASHSGASTWSEVAEKPFETIGQNLEVVDGVLNAKGEDIPNDIVLLANEITPSTPTPRDADTLGGIGASEYAKRMNPSLQGVINNTSFSTENKQLLNGFSDYMWVGNPELNSVNIQTTKRTLNANDIQKTLSVTNTPLDVTIPPRSSVNFSNIVTDNPGHFPLFIILTAASYGDYVTINQSHYSENGKITTSGYVGNWSDNEVTVTLYQQTLWVLND